MFYWSYHGVHVVLSDPQEDELLNDVTTSAMERGGYMTSHQVRRQVEKRMFTRLRDCLSDDPDHFNRKYVQHVAYGTEAQSVFLMLLDAYGRITKRATIGDLGDHNWMDVLSESVVYSDTDDLMHVTLLARARWPWQQPEPSTRIVFPASTIEKVAGAPDDFVLMTEQFNVRFGRDIVRLSLALSSSPATQNEV